MPTLKCFQNLGNSGVINSVLFFIMQRAKNNNNNNNDNNNNNNNNNNNLNIFIQDCCISFKKKREHMNPL